MKEETKDINKFYTYHQIQKDPKHIEFGWVEVDVVSPKNGLVVVARDRLQPSWDNITTLDDFSLYFLRLTSFEPSSFIERWANSIDDLKDSWMSTHPSTREDYYEFILKLAFLIRDRTEFEMYGKKYKVLDIGEQNEGGDAT